MGHPASKSHVLDSGSLFQWAFGSVPRGALFLSIEPAEFGSVIAANEKAAELTGLPGADLHGRDLVELLAPAAAALEHGLRAVASGEQPSWRLEQRIQRADRTTAWVRAEVSLVRDDEGRRRCLVAWLDETTEERRTAQRAETAAVAAEITMQAASVAGALSALLPSVAGRIGLDFAAVWEPAPEGDGLCCESLWQSRELSGRALATVTREIRVRGEGLVGAAWASGTAQCSPDMGAEGSPRGAAAASDGVRAAAALPVLNGPPEGFVLEFASLAPDGIDSGTFDALQQMTAQLGPLLARKRAEERPTTGEELLLVEDNPFIARLVAEMIDTSHTGLRLVHVDSLAAARERLLTTRPACVLLDLTLPDADGLHALLEARRAAPEVPIVVLTGLEDEGLAVRAVREGAQDYLMKRKVDLQTLSRAIRYAMERKGAEQQHLERRLRDPLTQLPNRVLFLDRLRVALTRSAGVQVGVLLLNLDRFRLVNDSLGPESGDRILSETAARLGRVLRAGTTLASFGGDEFAVLLDSADEASAMALAERLRDVLREPFVVDGQQIPMTASVGIALDRGDDGDADRLVREADTALSRGKEMGGQRAEMFAEAVRERLRSRLNLETGLRQALEERQLVTYFQPIMSLSSRTPVSMEALVRWRHPTRGILGPGEFMEVAEASGIVVPLGALVLDQALGQLADWHARMPAHRALSISVNLSARQLAAANLVETVRHAIADHGVPAGSVCLEVTETALIEDFDRSLEIMNALKNLGVKLALDDFGTGYSSLSYLHRLPVDVLKLDRSFVTAMRNEGTSSIVAAVGQMAAALHLPTVAEGVEEEADVVRLRAFGYPLAQGYLFGRPLPGDEATRLLASAQGGDTLPR